MTTTASQQPENASDSVDSAGGDALASLRIERPDPLAPHSRRRRRWIALLLILLVAAGAIAGYQWCAAKGWLPAWLDVNRAASADWVPDIIQNRPEVRLERVNVQTGRSADAVVVATGYLESRRQARIGARAPGRIEVLHFDEGTKVKQDEILAILEHADLEASLAAAAASISRAKAELVEQEIAIAQAKRETDRAEKLWTQRSIAESERDQATFAYQSAVARKESLAAQLELAVARHREAEQLKENMFIRAPFDGTVISKDAEVGESILPGGMGEASGRGSVATIADLEHLEVECDVKEDFITRISEEQHAEISVDAVPDKKYHGKVRKIIPMGDRARATIKVQVEITDADQFLFPEMSGTVYFLPAEEADGADDDRTRMFCPTAAVIEDANGDACVWVVDSEARVEKRIVTAGDSRDGKTEILEGLSGRERVIVNPQPWDEGQPVKVIE